MLLAEPLVYVYLHLFCNKGGVSPSTSSEWAMAHKM